MVRSLPSVCEVQSGIEGVIAFATEIAEPDIEGGALRYRGVDIEELVGRPAACWRCLTTSSASGTRSAT
jgi:citrate synthase